MLLKSVYFRPVQFFAVAFLLFASLATAATTVNNTILVLARDTASGYSASSGLKGYGIPFELIIVPQAGITLPTLNGSATAGNYGGIVILSDVIYNYPTTGYASALTAAQWTSLFTYQTSFGVRMVRLDVYPATEFGEILNDTTI
jgi:hypothetical protein